MPHGVSGRFSRPPVPCRAARDGSTGIGLKKTWKSIAIIAGWLLVWQAASLLIDNIILLAGPVETALALAEMVTTQDFWASLSFSFLRIAGGFLTGSAAGILLAYLAYRVPLAGDILSPLVTVLKAVPMASFIIIALIWFGSARVSFVISFIVVMPIVYLNALEGLHSLDRDLLEMADVFRIPALSRLRYIELPGAYPFLLGAFRLALGMSWKSGVAAELIGQYKLSVGNQLYMDKITLDTAGIFAWSAVIICASRLFEKAFLFLVERLAGSALRAPRHTPEGADRTSGT